MDNKLERLLDRNEKIINEIMKSKLNKNQKFELYDIYGNYLSGFYSHLEEQYPFLKEMLSKKHSQLDQTDVTMEMEEKKK